MKGIILAGGNGTRLAPLTDIISKQLLPVYDKPMICYPLATLMNLMIREILIISTPQDTPNIEKFLGDGSKLGIKLSYKIQDEPKGIAEAFLLGEEFIDGEEVCLILGDNIFYGAEISNLFLKDKIAKLGNEMGAYIFCYHVFDPERYGVVEFEKSHISSVDEKIISIEEKPKNPKSNWAATGLYFYNGKVCEYAKNLKPSARGELEITDLNKVYLEKNKLGAIKLKRGFAWLDAGTHDSLLDSANFIHTIEKRQGLKIGCLEEVALKREFIDIEQFKKIIKKYKEGSSYRRYLENIQQ